MNAMAGTFDYIVIGGGSGGATLASRLSEDPSVTVLLLEAGGDGRDLLIRAPAGVVAMLPGRPKINNWAFETVPQEALNGRRGYQPRGKALGGSSAINAMLYVRGHPSDYDGWAAQGCHGWAWKDVLPYFQRSEDNENGADELHGRSGPLQVSNQTEPRPVSHAFIEACGEMQHRINPDFNGHDQEGAGLYQVTQFHDPARRGERCSAAAAYLHPAMKRPNLTVITKALATRILFEGRRATGVEFRQGKDTRTVRANIEIALCGGAFNSPQLLMLSGVGDADHLRGKGIEVVHNLPGVGQNLQDHADFILSWKSRNTDMFGIGLRGTAHLLRHILRWRRDGTGMIATPFAEAGAFLKTKRDLDRPDIQLHFVISIVDDHARKLHLGYGFSCHVCVLRPHSRGSVRLADSDPQSAPLIDPRFLADPRDMETMIAGAKMTREIIRAPAMTPYRDRELYLPETLTDADWEREIRARCDTIYHPVGTCRMGQGGMAVVDPQLKVHGMEGLRVVDASIMPDLIGGNTNAPTIMIAEKAATMMAEARRQAAAA